MLLQKERSFSDTQAYLSEEQFIHFLLRLGLNYWSLKCAPLDKIISICRWIIYIYWYVVFVCWPSPDIFFISRTCKHNIQSYTHAFRNNFHWLIHFFSHLNCVGCVTFWKAKLFTSGINTVLISDKTKHLKGNVTKLIIIIFRFSLLPNFLPNNIPLPS